MYDDTERQASIDAWIRHREIMHGKAVVWWIVLLVLWGLFVATHGAYGYFAIVFTLNLFTGARLSRGFSALRYWFQTVLHVAGLSVFTWIIVLPG